MFALYFSTKAKKEYNGLEIPLRRKIEEILNILKLDPVPVRFCDIKKLRGMDGVYRIRIGRLRVVYAVVWNDKSIVISRISFRESAYD